MNLICKVITEEQKIENLLNMFIDLLPTLKDKTFKKILCDKLYKYAQVIAIEYKNDIVGFSAFYANDSIDKIAFLSLIAVLDKYQGKQIGTFLLKKTETFSREKNMKYLKLEVKKNNIKAISFYKKNYYQIIEENNQSFYMIKEL